MKISIVVPTRNRGKFLEYCLQTCLASKDQDLEIIVSDNNSIDDTESIVAAFQDPRLKYVNTGQDLSMRQNFEFALDHATGAYVLFIGDDDGIIPNGLVTLRHLIDSHRPDILLWRHITYLWPDPESPHVSGLLKFRSRDFCGPVLKFDPAQVYQDFCAGKVISYRDGANIYHGCISRRVIEKIKERSGEYFQGQSPDINTALSNLTVSDSMVWVRNPITVAGASPKSNGTAMSASKKVTKDQTDISKGFTDLAHKDQVTPEIDLRLRSVYAATYANLVRVNETLEPQQQDQINHAAWRDASISEMKAVPHDHRRWDLLEEFFSQADPNYTFADLQAADTPPPYTDAAVASRSNKTKKGSVPAKYTETVATAVDYIQTVTGKPYKPAGPNALLVILQMLKGLRMQTVVNQLRD